MPPRPGARSLQLEVIDRATDEAMQRLIEAGLIASATRAVRKLHPSGEGDRPLSEAERQKSKEYRRQVMRTMKMAQLLGGGGMAEEEREAFLQSALLLGKALAIERHRPEPKELEGLLARPNGWLWGETHGVLCNYAANPVMPSGPVAAALQKIVASAPV